MTFADAFARGRKKRLEPCHHVVVVATTLPGHPLGLSVARPSPRAGSTGGWGP